MTESDASKKRRFALQFMVTRSKLSPLIKENREYMEMTKSVDQHLNNNLLHDFGKVNPYRNLTKDFSVAHKNVKLASMWAAK